MRNSFLFTSESVSEGHPDKVADQISDTIVDLFLSKDPEARIACETLTTTQLVVLAGEIRCKGVYENGAWAPGAKEEIEAAVRGTVKDIRLSPTTVNNVVTYTVVVSAPNTDGRMLPGMTATLRIITDTRNDALRVPNAALRWRPAGSAGTSGGAAQAASGRRLF